MGFEKIGERIQTNQVFQSLILPYWGYTEQVQFLLANLTKKSRAHVNAEDRENISRYICTLKCAKRKVLFQTEEGQVDFYSFVMESIRTNRSHYFEYEFHFETDEDTLKKYFNQLREISDAFQLKYGSDIIESNLFTAKSVMIGWNCTSSSGFRPKVNFGTLPEKLDFGIWKDFVQFECIKDEDYLKLQDFQLLNVISQNVTFKSPHCPPVDHGAYSQEESKEGDMTASDTLKLQQIIIDNLSGKTLRMMVKTLNNITGKDSMKKFFKNREYPIRSLEIKHLKKLIPGDRYKALLKHCKEELFLSWEDRTSISYLSDLGEALAFRNAQIRDIEASEGLKLHISFGVESAQRNILEPTLSYDKISSTKCFFLNSCAGVWDCFEIKNSEVYIRNRTVIGKSENFYYIPNHEGIRGTMSQCLDPPNGEVLTYIEETKEASVIAVPIHNISSISCRNFEFLKTLVELKTPKIELDINLTKWSELEFLSEVDAMMNLNKNAYIAVRMYRCPTDLVTPTPLKNLSLASIVIPQEMREALVIFTRMLLDFGVKELKYFDLLDEEDSKYILGLLVEQGCPTNLEMILPNFQIGCVSAQKLLKSPSLLSLKLQCKGKRVMSKKLQSAITSTLVQKFTKTCEIEFQLPKSLLKFMNPKML
ncbi:unnamed protein product [Moneuplotes crassus]|uniref:Uncharacterized protein n=1 Tax=Euplotes crassus TaxID=5936 RepID=A0AAD1U0J2_EUPCR|nr:unnamed protein product [Moneuplotes crassus]